MALQHLPNICSSYWSRCIYPLKPPTSAAAATPGPLASNQTIFNQEMVSKPTIFFWGVMAATSLGIYIIHQTQVEEREVRTEPRSAPGAAAEAAGSVAVAAAVSQNCIVSPVLPPDLLPLVLQKLHKGVIRDAELYRSKKEQLLAGELTPAPAAPLQQR